GGSSGPADDSNELLGLKGVELVSGSSGTERIFSLYPYFMNNLRIGKGFEIGNRKGIGAGSREGNEVGSGSNGNNGHKGNSGNSGNIGNDGNSGPKFSSRKITMELRIDNLFNETYRNELQRFMPGRSYMLNLKYDF
ncbi:MAG: hypothetical protein LC655_06430, partial [Bacteroidales bacterium]|nr:hypothetical protein [Bacteroidales bacterium]